MPFPLVDITVVPDDEIVQHRRVALLELMQKHIRQRDLLGIVEHLTAILLSGYANDRQLKTLFNYLIHSGKALRLGIFIREVAIENMKKRGLDALVVIGGDGSYMGAKRLTEMGFPCIGLPGTIDNDIKGTDYTIGYFTALGTVVEAIDRLRDTSSSHQRISIVEVMGRYCGDLTLAAAIAGGCEFVVVPEVEFSREDLVAEIKAGIAKGKKHAIVAITEHICDVDELAKYIETETKRETRATVLGHIQRGGSPGPYDRILASRMGAYAIELLLQGHGGRCVGIQNEKLVHHDIIDAIENMKRPFKGDWLDCAKKLY